jgi:pre-mRNA-splicing factor RBM22/SLT11
MGERLLGIKTQVNKMTWEESEFPLVCPGCLGTVKYLRMMKTQFDRACRVCDRPFTVFRWRPGNKERFKKTEICQVCAKVKNVCQACVGDLQTGQQLKDRDATLEIDNKFGAPKDIVNLDYWAQINAEKVAKMNEIEKKKEEDEEKEVKTRELKNFK